MFHYICNRTYVFYINQEYPFYYDSLREMVALATEKYLFMSVCLSVFYEYKIKKCHKQIHLIFIFL